MDKKFTKDDLKVGYVVRARNGDLYIVLPGRKGDTILINANENYMHLCHKDDLTCEYLEHHDIVEVYGYCEFNYKSMRISTEDRELLWKREEEPKKTCDDCIHKVVCTHVGTCEHYMAKN